MRTYYMILKKNLLRRKTFSLILIVLSILTALFLVCAIGTIVRTQDLYEESYDCSGEKELIYGFLTDTYSFDYANHFEDEEKVADVAVTESLLGTIDIEEENIQTIFSVYNTSVNPYTIYDPDEEIEELNDNEILVPMNFKDSYGLSIGDIIEYSGTELFIKGFYEDPIYGSPFYHTKRILISEEMFHSLGTGANDMRRVTFLNIGIKEEYVGENLKDTIAELDSRFGESGDSLFSYSKTRLVTARTMVPRIILAILILFSIFLLCIMTIVIRYTVLAAIEDDYSSLGIMKAIGFKSKNLTRLLLCQYLFVVLIGLVIGIIGAYAVTPYIGGYLMATSGIVWLGNIEPLIAVALSIVFLLFVALIVYSQTRKAGKIKPVEAIVFGKKSESHKGKGLLINNLPLSAFPISIRMGFRQLFANFTQYISLLILVVIFSFMTITVAGLYYAFDSEESVAGILGYDINDLKIEIIDSETVSIKDVEILIKKIDTRYSVTYNTIYETGYDVNVDGEAIQLLVFSEFQTSNILSGRAPLSSNEIMISSGVRDEFGVEIGDSLALSLSENSEAIIYEIVGINNQVYDFGINITISEDGLKELYPDFTTSKFLLKINEHDNIEQAVETINTEFLAGHSGITVSNERAVMLNRVEAIQTTFLGITAGVIIISLLQIALITFLVSIVIIQRETVNCGIMKSVGFTPGQIRGQFINRFALISLSGSAIGVAASLISNGGLVNFIFSVVNIAQIPSGINPALLMFDILFITVTTVFCSWIVSRRIKKVNVRVLLSE